MFRAIWESRKSADCLGILRILRLPGQSAIAVYNYTASSLGELGCNSGTQRFYYLHCTLSFFVWDTFVSFGDKVSSFQMWG